ncbi:MAG: hypothetical protein ACYC6N_06820 [Pirellulaceae bacterium]
MNISRNRWLGVGLGLVVLFFVGDLGYRKLYQEPVEEHERLKEQLTKRLKTAKMEMAKSKRVGEQLEKLEQKSLPWDAEMARARYQDWLVQVAKDAKLTNTSVDSGDPTSTTMSAGKGKRSVEVFKRFTFSLRGRGDFGQVTKFLYDFYRGGHLHKVRSMSLNPVGQGQEVDLNVSIEALALPNADREAELTTLVSEQLAQADVRDYQLIARRNFFGSGGTESAWKQIQLSAVTSDVRGMGEAWFHVGAQTQTQILQLGQVLTMPSFEVRVVSLDETTATVSVDGRLYRLAIGQNLAEAVPVGEAPPTPPTLP